MSQKNWSQFMFSKNEELQKGLLSDKKGDNSFEGLLQLRKNPGTDTIEICEDNGSEYINLDASLSQISKLFLFLSLYQIL